MLFHIINIFLAYSKCEKLGHLDIYCSLPFVLNVGPSMMEE
jgi:hypothetical protein